MEFNHLAATLSESFREAENEETLARSLGHAARTMGFDHFALSCDFPPRRGAGLLVHDYPDEWAKVYVAFDLAGADPVRRACEKAVTGFAWGKIAQLIPMTSSDRQMLMVGRECGLGDGYTVPRHLPGAASGSCTFVVRTGAVLPAPMLLIAEIVGALALANALRIATPTHPRARPMLSERQRECVLWSARGKTAGEIAMILGISPETVIQHLKVARERYDVHCRQSLILCALFDGLIGFGDIFRAWDGS